MIIRVLFISILCFFSCSYASFANDYEHISGVVIDSQTQQPISGVYIKQLNSLNSIFNDQNGRYQLTILNDFPQVLVFSKEGYEKAQIDITIGSKDFVMKMSPIRTFKTVVPPAHTSKTKSTSKDLFGNQFTAFYQIHNGNHSFNQNSVNGLTINELGLNGHIQIYNWLFKGDFFRNRFPIDVANFPFQPAFFVNSLQGKLSAGQTFKLDSDLNVFIGGDILYHNSSPDNRSNQDSLPVPYTGTLLDFEQHRGALGGSLLVGWRLTDSIVFMPEVTLYPVGILGLNNASASTINYMLGGEVGARLKWTFAPGMALVGQYRKQMFGGFNGFFDNADYLNMGLSIDPWQMTEIMDTIKSLKIGQSQ